MFIYLFQPSLLLVYPISGFRWDMIGNAVQNIASAAFSKENPCKDSTGDFFTSYAIVAFTLLRRPRHLSSMAK
jgi:hypothetical protein